MPDPSSSTIDSYAVLNAQLKRGALTSEEKRDLEDILLRDSGLRITEPLSKPNSNENGV